MAGLGALTELDLDHLDLIARRLGREAFGIEAPLFVAAAEVAAGHLPDDVPALFAGIGADAAFAGVVVEAPQPGPPVERADRVCRQRTEAHGGNVEDRRRVRLR